MSSILLALFYFNIYKKIINMNVMLPKLMCIKKCMKTKFHCIMRVKI